MTTQEACVHHWKIESPNGNAGRSTGICIKCQAEKQFNNVTETTYNMWATKHKANERS